MPPDDTAVLAPDALEALVSELRERGFRVLGPAAREGAVVYEELESAARLPAGIGDEQEAGTYRLVDRGDAALFGHAASPHSWKQFFFPPHVRVWHARRAEGTIEFESEPAPEQPLALIGVRPCDLAAIAVQDRVFLREGRTERDYAARRAGAFLVAVDCGAPAATCFCTSLGTGPRADDGFDLALTEILEGEHRFLARAGSDRGAEVLAALPRRDANADDRAAAKEVVAGAADRMQRRLDPDDLRGLLARTLESPHWDEVAARCLACANCTLVCPTCFCSSAEDVTSLDGTETERVRRWDTCFSIDHSTMHGGAIRPSSRSRYRQWLTHKFGTWNDQFGVSGCVGCGRCIAWCPVGIDVTAELAALRAEEVGHADD